MMIFLKEGILTFIGDDAHIFFQPQNNLSYHHKYHTQSKPPDYCWKANILAKESKMPRLKKFHRRFHESQYRAEVVNRA